jgi:aryl-alcohol dehydrogenase-like predicted oxidoreductase
LPWKAGAIIKPAELSKQVDHSLRQLGVDCLDLLQLHRVHPDQITPVMETLLPAMDRLRLQGKARFFGITESSLSDAGHIMLQSALEADFFDTVMVGYHLGNTSAANTILPVARSRNVGVIGMVAARHLVPRSLAQRTGLFVRSLASLATAPPTLDKLVKRLQGIPASLRRGQVHGSVRILRDDEHTELTLPEVAYTFVTSHPAISTVLTGTTDLQHLKRNVEAALAPRLSDAEIERLRGYVTSN